MKKNMKPNHKKRIAYTSLMISILALSLFVAGASAAPEINVQVNDQSLENGEEMELSEDPVLDIEITSDDIIDFVDIDLPGGRSVDGVNEESYTASYNVSLSMGANIINIRARDQSGEESEFNATLNRDPETPAEVREYLTNLETRVNALEEDNEELSNYRDRLQRENENLSERNQELREQLDRENSLLPLPGMTAAIALLAIVSIIAATKIKGNR